MIHLLRFAFASPIRLLATLCIAALVLTMCARASAQVILVQTPGDFDGSFGGGDGKVPNIPVGDISSDVAAVALQPDGKIVLVGGCVDAGTVWKFCVVRLNADGGLDTTFDGPAGTGNGRFMFEIGTTGNGARAVAIQPDGKILISGICVNGGFVRFCLARLNVDGSFDTSFVGPASTASGRFSFSIVGENDYPTLLALQPDGRILVAGYCARGGATPTCAARLNADGSFDTSFRPSSPYGAGKYVFDVVDDNDNYNESIALQPDGKIVLAGYCPNSTSSQYFFCIARLTASGALDSTFSTDGKLKFSSTTGEDLLRRIAIQPDGKIVAVGRCSNIVCLARINSNGTLDTTFDGPESLNPGNGKFSLTLGAGFSEMPNVALQPDGKILVAAKCSGDGGAVCVARLGPDGRRDGTFDGPTGSGGGFVYLTIGSTNIIRAMALQPDGKTVLAGWCSDVICVARIYGGPFGYKNCSPDIDGDGRMTPTVDALINTRVMLGLTGSAVTGGINFPASAKRNSWSEIRNYLVSQCGMSIVP
jgi:uncharacterized delta-60 repeat protein